MRALRSLGCRCFYSEAPLSIGLFVPVVSFRSLESSTWPLTTGTPSGSKSGTAPKFVGSGCVSRFTVTHNSKRARDCLSLCLLYATSHPYARCANATWRNLGRAGVKWPMKRLKAKAPHSRQNAANIGPGKPSHGTHQAGPGLPNDTILHPKYTLAATLRRTPAIGIGKAAARQLSGSIASIRDEHGGARQTLANGRAGAVLSSRARFRSNYTRISVDSPPGGQESGLAAWSSCPGGNLSLIDLVLGRLHNQMVGVAWDRVDSDARIVHWPQRPVGERLERRGN